MLTEYKGFTITIEQDQEPVNPREDIDGLMGKFACFHKRYNLGDSDHGYDSKDYSGWGGMAQGITRKEGDIVVMEPLYLLDHSGLALQNGPFACDPGGWDSGMVGYAFVTKRAIRENYAIKHVTKKHIERARQELLNEIETYNKYLSGEVYAFSIRKTGQHDEEIVGFPDEVPVDSCCNFYGVKEAEAEAKAWIDANVARLEKKESEVLTPA
jgi:hypothetical protein